VSEVAIHRWPRGALTGDLVRATLAFGVALFFLFVLIPTARLTLFSLISVFTALVLVVLFGLYLAGTVSHLISVIEIDDQGIRLHGGLFGARAIKWTELERFELRHFPLSRNRKEGWMDLKLRGSGGRTIALDDRLDRFGEVLARAWEAARAANVGISDATHANLVASGILPKQRY
jgi:hypothetical protein